TALLDDGGGMPGRAQASGELREVLRGLEPEPHLHRIPELRPGGPRSAIPLGRSVQSDGPGRAGPAQGDEPGVPDPLPPGPEAESRRPGGVAVEVRAREHGGHGEPRVRVARVMPLVAVEVALLLVERHRLARWARQQALAAVALVPHVHGTAV